jgi:hypothetical protein
VYARALFFCKTPWPDVVVGVATGIVMGSVRKLGYSVCRRHLWCAACGEGIFLLPRIGFLELYLFGERRVSRGVPGFI